MRTKAAIFLAVFYACVMLAPHAALAFDAANVLHCIEDVVATSKHSHDDAAVASHSHHEAGAKHDHAGKPADRDGSGPPVACCGLFSVAAMPADMRIELGVAPRVSAVLPMPPDRLDGEGPGHINKPPRA